MHRPKAPRARARHPWASEVQNILLKNLTDVCIGTIGWWISGWAFAYGGPMPPSRREVSLFCWGLSGFVLDSQTNICGFLAFEALLDSCRRLHPKCQEGIKGPAQREPRNDDGFLDNGFIGALAAFHSLSPHCGPHSQALPGYTHRSAKEPTSSSALVP